MTREQSAEIAALANRYFDAKMRWESFGGIPINKNKSRDRFIDQELAWAEYMEAESLLNSAQGRCTHRQRRRSFSRLVQWFRKVTNAEHSR